MYRLADGGGGGGVVKKKKRRPFCALFFVVEREPNYRYLLCWLVQTRQLPQSLPSIVHCSKKLR